MKCVPAIALALVILPAAPIQADEARIPIFQPTTITQPGHYVLTRDISNGAGDGVGRHCDGAGRAGATAASVRDQDFWP